MGVTSVCLELPAVYATPVSVLEIKNSIFGWQESYLANSNHLSARKPLDLPLVVSLAASTGEPVVVPLNCLRPTAASQGSLVLGESVQEALEVLMPPVWEVSGTDGASLGVVGAAVDGEGPQPGDDAGSSLHDLVLCGTGLGMLRITAPGDVTPTPGSSGDTGSGVASVTSHP
jgi:hypothetical protein